MTVATVTLPVQLQQVLMTPEWAKSLLDGRVPNRSIRRLVVNAIAHDIRNGRFDSSVIAPIRVNRNGQLTDGQHRLSAIVACGIPTLLWMETTDSNCFDLGKIRTAPDLLTMGGIQYGKNITSACRIILECERMREEKLRWSMSTKPSQSVSAVALVEAFRQRPAIAEFVPVAMSLYHKQPRYTRMFGASSATALMYFSFVDLGEPSHAVQMLSEIADGIGEYGEATYAYRRFAGNMSSADRIRLEFAMLMHCLRLRYHGQKCAMLKITSFGDISDLRRAPRTL